MLFKITTHDNTVWTYDNMTNHIESLSGCPNNIEAVKDCFPYDGPKDEAPRISRDERYVRFQGKSRNIRKLRILLGINCNYKCSFCLQGKEGVNLSSPVVRGEKLANFMRLLVQAELNFDNLKKVELWGGEPLVYWKSIKELVPILREKFPDVEISMISNGTLITDEILDFLVKHKVELTFSHDAQAYFLRGPDPLDNPKMVEMWKKVYRRYKEAGLSFGVNVVISQYNADLFAIQDFFAQKIDPGLNFGFEGVVIAHTPNAIPFTKFPKEAYDKLRRSIFRAIVEEPTSNVGVAFRHYVVDWLKRLVNKVPANTIRGRCDATNPHVLGVDMFGNVLSCHNVSMTEQTIGTLVEYDKVKMDKFDHWSVRHFCPDCYVLNGCQGNCVRNDAFAHKASCQVECMFHGFIFEAVWFLLTNKTIASIEAIDG